MSSVKKQTFSFSFFFNRVAFMLILRLSLAPFRALLTTALMQVCTVIRFSLSRFVPAREPSPLSGPRRQSGRCWPVSAGRRERPLSSSLLSLSDFHFWTLRDPSALFLILPPLYFSFLCVLLPSQMVYPRYDHSFLSGEQSSSFQKRILKVDLKWRSFFLTLTLFYSSFLPLISIISSTDPVALKCFIVEWAWI